MKRFLLEIQIGFLIIVGITLVLGAGYLAYTGISSIVKTISKEAEPDIKLTLIQQLASDLEMAENSVRLFSYTQSEDDLKPYYGLLASIEQQIDEIRVEGQSNARFLENIDTVEQLIASKVIIWEQMIPLYSVKYADRYLDTISTTLEEKVILDSIRENRSFLKKIFQRSKRAELDEEKIIREIEQAKADDQQVIFQIKKQELKLARANSKLTGQLYGLIRRMEEEEKKLMKQKAAEAKVLAGETYRWIGWFALTATLSMLLVIFFVSRYLRKSAKYEKALIKAKNEAENLAAAKEMFMANVSHEVRTPLNVISGFVNQLLKKSHEEETGNTLKIIKSSTDHLVRIVNDILDFSKLQSGKMYLEPTHYILRDVFDQMYQLFENEAKAKGLDLFFSIDTSLPEVVFGDQVRLKQIVINLLGNAIKFTSSGSVEVRVVQENKIAGHFDLLVVVKDTGIGIPKDKKKEIFEDFMQAEAGTSHKFGGTGLGLSIVKKLVGLHNGTIQVESEPGKGSEFVCRLNYKTGEMAKVKKLIELEDKEQHDLSELRFLIVDDEIYNRQLIRSILNKWNVKIQEAENGKIALEKLEKDNYDMILMDKRMPVMDGLDASAGIYERYKSTNNLPVIILITAESVSKSKMETFKKIGIRAYLPKPFTEQDLFKTMVKLGIISEKPKEIIPEPAIQTEKINLDLEQLYRVSGNDQVFVAEMLEKFIESFESGYEEMIRHTEQKAFKETGNVAHKLASPSRHIGAEQLLNVLKLIESYSEENPEQDKIRKDIEKAREEFEKVKKDIRKHLETMHQTN